MHTALSTEMKNQVFLTLSIFLGNMLIYIDIINLNAVIPLRVAMLV